MTTPSFSIIDLSTGTVFSEQQGTIVTFASTREEAERTVREIAEGSFDGRERDIATLIIEEN